MPAVGRLWPSEDDEVDGDDYSDDDYSDDDGDDDGDGDGDVSGIAVWPTMPTLPHLCRYDSGRSRRNNMMMMICIL